MKKLMFAALSLVCTVAIATGGAPAPAAAAPTAPEIGGCRWVCGGNPTRFTSASACQAACSTECEVLC
jgi:hypothetical protein